MEYINLETPMQVTGLVSAFRCNLQQDFRYDGEVHTGWEFVYVESGRIMAQADDKRYIVRSGEMIFHKPMEYHNLNPYHGDATIIVCCFHCSYPDIKFFENKILSLNQRQKQYLADIVANGEAFLLQKDPKEISADGRMFSKPGSAAVNGQAIKNTIELLLLSLHATQGVPVQSRANSYSQHLTRKRLTEGICSYLEKNLGKSICLAEIAETFSYSVSTVKTVFREETGKSIIAYYNDLRLSAAKELLKENTLSISEIAEQLGFHSTSHFSSFFKKETGTSPNRFEK